MTGEFFTIANITGVGSILLVIGSLLWKVFSIKTEITVLEKRIEFLEKVVSENAQDLKEFEQQTLHYLERIESKIDHFIIKGS